MTNDERYAYKTAIRNAKTPKERTARVKELNDRLREEDREYAKELKALNRDLAPGIEISYHLRYWSGDDVRGGDWEVYRLGASGRIKGLGKTRQMVGLFSIHMPDEKCYIAIGDHPKTGRVGTLAVRKSLEAAVAAGRRVVGDR